MMRDACNVLALNLKPTPSVKKRIAQVSQMFHMLAMYTRNFIRSWAGSAAITCREKTRERCKQKQTSTIHLENSSEA